MKNIRSYYSASIQEFLAQDNSAILGNIVSNYQMAQLSDMMEYSWEEEIPILKEQLKSFSEGRIIFEYVIPRMGKRIAMPTKFLPSQELLAKHREHLVQ